MPSKEEIRSQLHRILEGEAFRNAPRMSDFLRFVVEAKLDRPEMNVKETTVATTQLAGRFAL